MNTNFFWLKSQVIQKVLSLLSYNSHNYKFVGGCIRDSLTNNYHNINEIDFDIASNLTPEENIYHLEKAKYKVIKTGIDYGTITIFVDNKAFQITTLRKDVLTDGRHAKVVFGNDFYEDAKRRDFTFNAIYFSPKNHEITDYFNGRNHLIEGKIEFIGNPELRIKEDYLRILRFFRFFALYGKILPDESLLNILTDNAKNIANLSKERICYELERTVTAKNPLAALNLMNLCEITNYIIAFDEKNIALFPNLLEIEEKTKIYDKNLRIAFLTTDKNMLMKNNIITKKSDLNEICLILELKNFIVKFKVIHFNEICHLLVHYPYKYVLYALICACAENNNLKSHYLGIIKKIEEKSLISFPITGHDLIKIGIKDGKTIGKILKNLKILFWQMSASNENITKKDYYLNIIKNNIY